MQSVLFTHWWWWWSRAPNKLIILWPISRTHRLDLASLPRVRPKFNRLKKTRFCRLKHSKRSNIWTRKFYASISILDHISPSLSRPLVLSKWSSGTGIPGQTDIDMFRSRTYPQKQWKQTNLDGTLSNRIRRPLHIQHKKKDDARNLRHFKNNKKSNPGIFGQQRYSAWSGLFVPHILIALIFVFGENSDKARCLYLTDKMTNGYLSVFDYKS